MEHQHKKSDYTLGALVHLSTFSKYIVPLGNFIFPLIIWTLGKKDKFIDEHGKQVLNFQISTFLYFVAIVCATATSIVFIGLNQGFENDFYFFNYGVHPENISEAIPFIIVFGISGILLLALFILELVCVINATIHAHEGKYYKYPLSLPFIKISKHSADEHYNNIQNETL